MRLLLLVLAAGSAGAIDWNDGDVVIQAGETVRQERPAPRDAGTAPGLECNPRVIAAFKRAWEMADSGKSSLEAGFRIDRVEGGFVAVFAPKMESNGVSIPVRTGVTVAIAHTHPNAVPSHPSSTDRRAPLPFYTISRDILYVTDPATRAYHIVRYDWASSCR